MKKYFLIFFFVILIITFSNRTVQASSLTDILSSLTDTLYSLKKILSADIYMGSGYICNNNAHQCYPSPFMYTNGKSFDECAATCFSSSSRPIITSNMIKCQSNSDCALVDTECCVAAAIGQPSSSERSFASNPIRKGYLSDFVHNVNAYCHIYSPMCPAVAGRFYDYEYYTTCENNVCVAHKELWHPSTPNPPAPTPNPPAAATQWYTHNSMVSPNDH